MARACRPSRPFPGARCPTPRSSLGRAAFAAALLALGLPGGLCAQSGAQLVAPAAADPRLEWSGPIGELHRQLAGPLRASRKDAGHGEGCLAKLVAPGSAAIAPLFDILVQERIPRVRPDDPAQLLSAPQRQLVLSALAKLPASGVRAEIERRVPQPAAQAESSARLAVLRVLSVIGNGSDLAALPALAPREREELGPVAADALREAYAGILRREPALLGNGLELLRTCDPAAAKQCLFAIGDLGDKRALPLLDDCVHSLPSLAQQAVSLVPRVGASGKPEIDVAFAAWLAERIDPERPEWSRACLRAIGILDDGSQVQVLLEALESPSAGLREAALASLQLQSGLQLGPGIQAWREWFARESDWRSEGRQAAQLALASENEAQVAQALNNYAEHKLFKSELAEDVLAVLEHASPAMRGLACATLARIGSRHALPALVEHFSDEDTQFAEAAWRAACALSGQELPRTSDEARARLSNR